MEQPPAWNPAPGLPPRPPRKGLPPLAWAGIGCGGIAIAAMVVASVMAVGWLRTASDTFMANPDRAAAELLVRMNPDLEIVHHDGETGQLTIRTAAGEELTLGYGEIAEGRFTYRDAAGNTVDFGTADLSKVPDWVPRVPGIGLRGDLAAIHSRDGGRVSGFYSGTTTAGIDEVEEGFRAEAGFTGLTSSRSSFRRLNGVERRTLVLSGSGRETTLLVHAVDGEAIKVRVGYQGTP